MFIVFEGGEGVGKSTQINLLAKYLTRQKIHWLKVHCPGTTSLGLHLRDLLLQREHPLGSPMEELLFIASIMDVYQAKILPALKDDQWVLCDRFIDSCRVYQGYHKVGHCRDIDDMLYSASKMMGPHPLRVVFHLICDGKTAMHRVLSRGILNIYDNKGQTFYDNQALMFDKLKDLNSPFGSVRMIDIDAARDYQDVHRTIVTHLTALKEEMLG